MCNSRLKMQQRTLAMGRFWGLLAFFRVMMMMMMMMSMTFMDMGLNPKYNHKHAHAIGSMHMIIAVAQMM
jgi:peptide methionine sulfoxide reductase MsrA